MSLHFEKLKCGPRAVLLMAEAAGRPIDPDELYSRFEKDLAGSPEKPGAIFVSSLIDMARSFGLARHVDLTHDIQKADYALKSPDVFGILVSWERAPVDAHKPEELSPHGHIARLRRCEAVESMSGVYRGIEVESPRWPEGPDILFFPTSYFVQMMAGFWIFYRP